MSDFLHGVRVVEVHDAQRPIRSIQTAVIGLLCTADDADASLFPLDTPVLITDLAAALAKAGQRGTLSASLAAILRQANAMTIVVRVAENEDAKQQEALLIGEYRDGHYTGAKALLTAESRLRVTPRILGCPQLDSQAVTTELVSIAQKLRAFVYAHARGNSKEEAALYEQHFAARELMLIYGDFVGFEESKKQRMTIDSVATALGLRARIDADYGWHKTLSNVAVNGVMGLQPHLSFNLSDPSNDANYLNSKNVTALIHRDGYRFWGNRSAADDPLFAFESATRTAQIIADSIDEAFLWALDKPLSAGLASDIILSIDAKLREWTTAGYLLGGSAWFDARSNPKEALQSGKLNIHYDYTPVPPLEHLQLTQKITDIYLLDFSHRLESLGHKNSFKDTK